MWLRCNLWAAHSTERLDAYSPVNKRAWASHLSLEQVPYFPPTQTKADFPPNVCKDMLRAAVGLPAMDLDIHSIRTWTMHAEVADCFKVGRLLLPSQQDGVRF